MDIDSEGRIYFTDASYGLSPEEILMKESVYRIDTEDGKFSVHRIISDLEMPNGIAVSKDEKTLYVVDAGPNHQKVWAYQLFENGETGTRIKSAALVD